MHRGRGGGSGKVSVRDIHFLHYVDAATPGLIVACCQGTHFSEATFTMRKAGGEPLPYLTIKLKEIVVTSVRTGAHQFQAMPTETFSLNFSSFDLSYQKQNVLGARLGGAVTVMYDIARNA